MGKPEKIDLWPIIAAVFLLLAFVFSAGEIAEWEQQGIERRIKQSVRELEEHVKRKNGIRREGDFTTPGS
jgi:hypothetical protein